MNRRVFNLSAISVACLVILWITGIFYLGSQEQGMQLRNNLSVEFTRRAASGIAIGIAVSLLLAVINMFLNRIFDSTSKVGIRKLLLISMCATAAAAVVGTAAFFWL